MRQTLTLEGLVKSPSEFVIFDYDRTIATLPIDWERQRIEFRAFLGDMGVDLSQVPESRVDEAERFAVETLGLDWEQVYAFRRRVEGEQGGAHVPNPVVCDAVRRLAEGSSKLCILSNNLRQTVMSGLDQLDLKDKFACVLGVDDTRDPKPGTRGLDLLKQRVGLNQKQAILVGDSPVTDGVFCERTGIDFLKVDSFIRNKG